MEATTNVTLFFFPLEKNGLGKLVLERQGVMLEGYFPGVSAGGGLGPREPRSSRRVPSKGCRIPPGSACCPEVVGSQGEAGAGLGRGGGLANPSAAGGSHHLCPGACPSPS